MNHMNRQMSLRYPDGFLQIGEVQEDDGFDMGEMMYRAMEDVIDKPVTASININN